MARFKNWQKPTLKHGEPTKWQWVCWHPEGLEMGENVDIGAYCYLQARKGIVIGNNVQIGGHTTIYSVSTIRGLKEGRVVIEDNAEIGAHVLILPGVTIGKGAFVRAFTTVVHDVPAGKEVGPFETW